MNFVVFLYFDMSRINDEPSTYFINMVKFAGHGFQQHTISSSHECIMVRDHIMVVIEQNFVCLMLGDNAPADLDLLLLGLDNYMIQCNVPILQPKARSTHKCGPYHVFRLGPKEYQMHHLNNYDVIIVAGDTVTTRRSFDDAIANYIKTELVGGPFVTRIIESTP